MLHPASGSIVMLFSFLSVKANIDILLHQTIWIQFLRIWSFAASGCIQDDQAVQKTSSSQSSPTKSLALQNLQIICSLQAS